MIGRRVFRGAFVPLSLSILLLGLSSESKIHFWYVSLLHPTIGTANLNAETSIRSYIPETTSQDLNTLLLGCEKIENMWSVLNTYIDQHALIWCLVLGVWVAIW